MYLEPNLYTCSALAEKFNVSIESSNFKRDICKKLEDSGYEYNYIHKTKGIEIKGQVGQKELTEIELKKYLISIGFGRNVNVRAVALYLFLLSDDYYKNAPYNKIAKVMIEDYNITEYIDLERTLGDWTKKIKDNNLIHTTKNTDNIWVTFDTKKGKVQKHLLELTIAERDIYNKYIEKRKKLLDDGIKYSVMLKSLWKRYKICVYKGLTKELNGINSALIKKFIDFFLLE